MRFARSAAHVHSDWSYDGTWTLDELAAAFRRRRYAAILLSEHDRTFDADRWAGYREACARASRGILLVPGIEYSNADNTVHTLVWGPREFLGRALPTADLVASAREQGGVAVLAHPDWKGAAARLDRAMLAALDGVEWWNRRYDGLAPSAAAARLGVAATPYVGLDFHTRRQFFPLAMRIGVDGALTPEAVFGALRARDARAEAGHTGVERLARGAPLQALRAADRAKDAAITASRPARRAWRSARER